MTGFTPTVEQEIIEGAFTSGADVEVQAGAGCGKTSTLVLLGQAAGLRVGSYVAFNRSIVQEAGEKLPVNVSASTIHSQAMRAVGNKYRHRLDAPRVKSWELAKLLGIRHGLTIRMEGGRVKNLAAGFLASLTMRTVKAFCASADLEPGPHHVPWLDGIDPPRGRGEPSPNNDEVRRFVMPTVVRAWADLSNPAGVVPYNRDHGFYLKVWALGTPTIGGEFVMVDECQDLSGVMVQALEYNRRQGKQFVLVGDTQQSIYGWMGSVNAFDVFGCDVTTTLSRSFRFGQAIADVANVVLDDLDAALRLEGNPAKTSNVQPLGTPRCVLTRTNAVAVETVLRSIAAGRAPHLVGGGEEVVSFARAAIDLQEGRKTWHPDLACFDDWTEVQDYVRDDPSGGELALLVKLLDEYGAQIVMDALEGMPGERAADVVVSTAHKAKGREWDSVRLGPDFPKLGNGDEELRLLYVAATRARDRLDVRFCEPLVELLDLAKKRAALPLPTPVALTTGATDA